MFKFFIYLELILRVQCKDPTLGYRFGSNFFFVPVGHPVVLIPFTDTQTFLILMKSIYFWLLVLFVSCLRNICLI